MERGEIWWANLAEPTGSGPGFRRPVLIVQSDAFNLGRIPTVIVAALTGNLRASNFPGNVLVRRADTGLPMDSVVNVSQIVTVDRNELDARVSQLPKPVMSLVDEGLRLILDLA